MHCVAEVVSLHYKWWENSTPLPSQTPLLSTKSFVYLQMSVWPHDGLRVAIAKERWLTTRDNGQELPVHLFLLFTNRLHKDDRTRQSQQKKDNCFSRNSSFLFWYPTSCAVLWCLLVWRWPDEAPCVGLCIAFMGNVFSHLLVQELFAMPVLKMQRRYYIYTLSTMY